jgi:hypothetical protein
MLIFEKKSEKRGKRELLDGGGNSPLSVESSTYHSLV